MFINEVIHKVGLSRKSVRYYELVGLIKPKRNKNNDYRIYTEEEINKLKIIKFLRELDVSIKELQLLNENKLTLKECMDDKIKKIEENERNFQKVKNICMELSKENENFHNIYIDKYFVEINKLNKDGFTMKNRKINIIKKILGAIISSVIFELLFISLIATITYFQLTEVEKIPWIIYMLILIIFLFPIVAIIINLVRRIREIKGGEEDEASNY